MLDYITLSLISVLMSGQFELTPWVLTPTGGNCEDVSREQVEMLRENEYNAYQLKGHCNWHEPNTNHAFIGILNITHNPRQENWFIFDINGIRINNGNGFFCDINN